MSTFFFHSHVFSLFFSAGDHTFSIWKKCASEGELSGAEDLFGVEMTFYFLFFFLLLVRQCAPSELPEMGLFGFFMFVV